MAIDAGKRCGNWPTTVPACGSCDEEAHEPQCCSTPCVLCDGKNRSRVAGGTLATTGSWIDERAALRDLDALVHVGAGVLAADHVLRRREDTATAPRATSAAGTTAPTGAAAGAGEYAQATAAAQREQQATAPR